VNPDPQVESLFTGSLDNVLVGANSSSLQSLGGQLLVLVGNEMATEGEVVDIGPLSSQIKDSNLGVGDTTIVSGLGEPVHISMSVEESGLPESKTLNIMDLRLVLTVSVTPCGTSTHLDSGD
jgi:co-chaperonin GroES (HSP10)